MNIFKRLFKIGLSETHSTIDGLENPIKMVEQGIREMKTDLDTALKSLAEVKAMHIRRGNDLKQLKNKEESYQSKSILLLKKAQNGELEMMEADRLVKENLKRKEEISDQLKSTTKEVSTLSIQVTNLEKSVEKLRSDISKWENEAKTLNARVKVSNATKKINKQMANVDSSSVTNMLERMKDKVVEQEALAEAYGDIANSNTSHEDEIEAILEGTSVDDELAKLKDQLGIKKGGESDA